MLCFQEPTLHSDWPVLTSVIDRQQIFVFLNISISRSCSSVDCLSYVHIIPLHTIPKLCSHYTSLPLCPGPGQREFGALNSFPYSLKFTSISGFQYSLLLIYFRDGPKRCSHCKIDTKPIRYVTFHFWDRRGMVSLRHRNRSAKIVLVYEQKWTEAPSGKIFVAAQRPSLGWHWIAFFQSYLTALFFLFSIVFFDSSSSCLLVWTGISCQTVIDLRSERRRWRQRKSRGWGKGSSCFSSTIYSHTNLSEMTNYIDLATVLMYWNFRLLKCLSPVFSHIKGTGSRCKTKTFGSTINSALVVLA